MIFKIKLTTAAVTIIAAFSFACQQAQETEPASDDATAVSEDGTQIYQGKGVVKSIDKNQKEIAIAHEEIKGLMSAMTMDFKVRDASMLETVAPGDQIDFELERKGSELTVTKILRSGGNKYEEGETVYKANCAECHGAKGAGTEKGISFLKGHALDHPREDFVKQVREGEEDEMPAFKDKLSDDEIEAVVSYVRDVIQKDVKKEEKKKDTGSHQH